MIVCSCNVISDSDVRCAVLAGGARTVGSIYRGAGKAPRCGRCIPTMREMLAELCPGLSPASGAGLQAAAAPAE